jgi:Raf kinase inhibitor-like YbhB/YbcL family protein
MQTMKALTVIVSGIAILAAGCKKQGPVERPEPVDEGPAPDSGGMTLTSPDFDEGQPIPKKHAYEGEGENEPPRLEWSGLPEGTVELALIVDDRDAPTPEPWVHDVLYKIPVDATAELMVMRGAAVDSMALYFEGTNSWDKAGWGGPMPPEGDPPHRYHFRLYALDVALDVSPGLTKDELLEAMQGHVLGTATLMGTYQR